MEDAFAELVQQLWEIRDFYLKHSTEQSKRRVTALGEINEDLNLIGVEGTFLIQSSLAAGMSVEESDIDLVYVGDLKAFEFNNPSAYGSLERRLYAKLGTQVKVSHRGPIELSELKKALKPPIRPKYLAVFYKHYRMCRKIDTRLDRIFEEVSRMVTQDSILSERIKMTGLFDSWVIWRDSFEKYHDRIGILIPPEHIKREQDFVRKVREYNPQFN